MKNKLTLERILYSLIIIFLLLVICILIPLPSETKGTLFPLIAIFGFIFLILGTALVFLARKEKGKLKLFLKLTGTSVIATFTSSILHNLFYGLAITFENLKLLFEALHVTFFIISIIVAPITFIIGIVGSAILFKGMKKKK